MAIWACCSAVGPHQYGGDDEALVSQSLRDVDVQTGGVHQQSVIRVPDPNLTQRLLRNEAIKTKMVALFKMCVRVYVYLYNVKTITTVDVYGMSPFRCVRINVYACVFNLFVASPVLLQNMEGVIGPLAFTVELNSTCQAIILHLIKTWEERKKENRNSYVTLNNAMGAL